MWVVSCLQSNGFYNRSHSVGCVVGFPHSFVQQCRVETHICIAWWSCLLLSVKLCYLPKALGLLFHMFEGSQKGRERGGKKIQDLMHCNPSCCRDTLVMTQVESILRERKGRLFFLPEWGFRGRVGYMVRCVWPQRWKLACFTDNVARLQNDLSVCSLILVTLQDGRIVKTWSLLIL